ncbi:MAG: LOG family protein [Acidimicrobiales bacterium]
MGLLADAFIMLPGGFGTLEEFMEVVTWRQLGLHDKPVGLLNLDGYFDDLLRFVTRAVDMGFVRPGHAETMAVADDPRWS